MGSPLFMRDVSLTLKTVGGAGAAAEFACDVHLAEIVPSAGDEVTYQTLCAEGTHTQIGKSTYALHIVAGQVWDAGGLATFLWEHEGEEATFVYQAHGEDVPISATAPGMTGNVRLVAGAYGGEAESYAELDVELPCTSRPDLLTAPPVAADEEAQAEAVA